MLKTEVLGIKFRNPLILASGILGVSSDIMKRVVVEGGAGAVTFKSIGPEKRDGHPNPVMISCGDVFMNAVGLSNAGVDNSFEEVNQAVKEINAPVIVSIFSFQKNKFGEVAEKVSKLNPAMIEVNISCPNVESEAGKPFALNPETAADVTRIVKSKSKLPVIIKLSPNSPDIKEIAKAVEKAGADMINSGNTFGPGMAINLDTAKPILHNKVGGISGPAIKPMAVKCVYDIYEAVKIPIIGTGGVTYGRDAVEMMMAGASLVGIGTGVYYRGMDVFKKVALEMGQWMKENQYRNVKELVGRAHE